MSEIIEQPTAEQIASHYSAAMDSVNLIQEQQAIIESLKARLDAAGP